jgi:hypothetical protein
MPVKLRWYVNASYAVPVDGKRRIGNVVTLGILE